MERPEALSYFQTLGSLLRTEPDRLVRKSFLTAERGKIEFQDAFQKLRQEKEQVKQPLTERQQISLWARDTLSTYQQIPQSNRHERKKAERIVDQAAGRLIQEPGIIDTAGSIWRVASHDEEGKIIQGSFFDQVTNSARRQSRETWPQISSEQLAGLVRAYAHSTLGKDIAHEALRGYFRGPQTTDEVVRAFRSFTSGAIDLVDDAQAINQAVRIGNYDTEILPPNTRFHSGHLVAINTLDNDRILGDILVADKIMFEMAILSSLSIKTLARDHTQKTALNTEAQQQMSKADRRVIGKYGQKEYDRRKTALTKVHETEIHDMDLAEIKRLSQTWPFSLVYNDQDPLKQKYLRHAASIIQGAAFRDLIADQVFEQQNSDSVDRVYTSVRSPDGTVISAYLPKFLVQRKAVVLGDILRSNSDILQKTRDFATFGEVGVGYGENTYHGNPVYFWLRDQAELEGKTHPITALEEFGFPVPYVGEGATIGLVNTALADRIQKTQIRFLNRRGVRKPLQERALADLGYQFIDFQKDTQDSEKTVVSVGIGDLTYQVKLDRSFNLDLDGRPIPSRVFAESLHHVVLKALEPIISRERIKIGGNGPERAEIEVISRMGHIRMLEEGKKHSEQAEEKYKQWEGQDKDLKIKEAQMKVERKTTRNFTFVSPVVEKDEALPPIELNYPLDVQFATAT